MSTPVGHPLPAARPGGKPAPRKRGDLVGSGARDGMVERAALLSPAEEQWYTYYLRHQHSPQARVRPLVKTRLGAALLRWMYEAHLTHKEAQEALGISAKVLWRYLTCGLRPSTRTLARMHRATGLPGEQLLRLAALCPPYVRDVPSDASARGQRRPTRRMAPVPTDAWEAFTQRVLAVLPPGAERRAILAEIEALRGGALSPAQRVVRAPSTTGATAAMPTGLGGMYRGVGEEACHEPAQMVQSARPTAP